MKLTKILVASFCASTLMSGAALAQTDLTMWYHGAGNDVESKIINQIVDDFNTSQSDWKVNIESFPQTSYNDSVVAAALAGNLPDIIDVDGPIMPNWAWSGYMQPLQIDESKIENFLPGTKGVWDGKLYSIGLWDAAVALYARTSTLEELGLRTPTLDKPWTKDEFMDALKKAKASGNYKYALDLGMNDQGEWYPYAYSPFLQSFGGDIVDRSTYKTAEGALNGDAGLAFGEWWQSLFTEGYAPGTSESPADQQTGFIDGSFAFQWNGNWRAVATMAEVDDVVFLPAPDMGNGPMIGAGSWQFGVAKTSEHPDGASAFIEFALQDKYLAAFSDGIGLIPSTASAAQMTENYKDGGPLAVFYDLSNAQAKVRPVTPGYVVQSKVFTKAMADLANGADVADTLDAAVDEINADIEKNSGYGH
ncbi:carbohydrate ABC transporter substrate-binding protein, CUT1 family (TC 3.A.1.1.-) [Cohaesibacter marisflavi]|uniref:Carbohydrate ABC transporter substrate-binding protein, CUT1 family (TC 3.A.1.1.-) n=1 Tax=Cohaesibacter marisflavi TaxID=655353 RepID=A0A1I5L7Q7_9HYPH|nr:sugar ABC transporter substrate-binding protein [Cohaesibacter marisflavi]SFO93255.1 carbohydrate ABC transporter substrate-binding protein, CUT1 family (TC 3.A.1.1.-) [Cohaesibacter marisflavi]